MEQHTHDTVSPEIDVSPEINVSPEIKVSPEPSASTEPTAPRVRQRCRARRRDGRHCRLFAQDPATGLCARHAAYAETLPDELLDTTDLSKQLLVVNEGGYCSADSINAILSNVIELLAKGRISPRRASVITFALSLLLRSVVVVDRKIANTSPQFIFDAPRPNRDPVQPETSAAPGTSPSPRAYPQTSHDAAENYARPRT
jgi:hypothetical protein